MNLETYFQKFREAFSSKTIILTESPKKQLTWNSFAHLETEKISFTFQLFHYSGQECAQRISRLLFELVEHVTHLSGSATVSSPYKSKSSLPFITSTSLQTQKKLGGTDSEEPKSSSKSKYLIEDEEEDNRVPPFHTATSVATNQRTSNNNNLASYDTSPKKKSTSLKRKSGYSLINPNVKRYGNEMNFLFNKFTCLNIISKIEKLQKEPS